MKVKTSELIGVALDWAVGKLSNSEPDVTFEVIDGVPCGTYIDPDDGKKVRLPRTDGR